MARLRLGVVLLFAPAVSAALDTLRLALGDPGRERIEPHLTLISPLSLPAARLGEVSELLGRVASGTAPLRVRLGPPATFFPLSPVVYSPLIEGAGQVRALRRLVAVAPLERRSQWPYVPHVTLHEDATQGRIEAALGCLDNFSAMASVECIALMHRESGKRWEVLADFVLSGRPQRVGTGGFELLLAAAGRPDPQAAEWRRGCHSGLFGPDQGVPAPLVITARHGGEVVGMATWRLRSPAMELADLAVEPSLARMGIGRQLLLAGEREAAAAGFFRLEAVVAPGSAAQHYLQHWGWRPRHLLARWFPASAGILLEKVLGERPVAQ